MNQVLRVKYLNLKAQSGLRACWARSALGFQLAQSDQIPLLCSFCSWELSPYISTVPSPPSPPSCAPENIFSPITITTVSNEPYPPPHFRLCRHVLISFFQYCLWGHWVWEEERGCRGGVSVAVGVLGVQSARFSI